MMNKHHLGPLVRCIREARGISLNELCFELDFSSSPYSRWERGYDKTIKQVPENLQPIADLLNTTVPALFLMQEICIADPSIVGSPALLLEHLERVTNEMDRLVARIAWKPQQAANG